MFKVSIVTVSLNAKKEIQGTIESVLSQTYPLIEYILIDGDRLCVGSTNKASP